MIKHSALSGLMVYVLVLPLAAPASAAPAARWMTSVSGDDLFLLALQAYAFLAVAELLWRLRQGASLFSPIAETEVTLLGAGLGCAMVAGFIVSAASVILTLRGLWAVFVEAHTFSWASLMSALSPLAVGAVSLCIAGLVAGWFAGSSKSAKPSAIDIRGVTQGIGAGRIAAIGKERFPVWTRTYGHAGWIMRVILLIALGVAIVGLLTADIGASAGAAPGFKGVATAAFCEIARFYQDNRPSFPQAEGFADYAVPYAGTTLLLITFLGSGRLKYDQQIVTVWRADSVAASYPEIEANEITRDAGEIQFAALPLIEDRRQLTGPASTRLLSSSETSDVMQSLMHCRNRGLEWAGVLQGMLGGHVYRSEVSLWGYVMIRCVFGRMFQTTGWFFGATPGFHVTRLPLDFAAVGMLVLAPALLGFTLAHGASLFGTVWASAAQLAYHPQGR